MPDINYVNPQIKNTVKQEISIQVSLSGFSFLIKSEATRDCLLFRSYKFKNILLIDELIRKAEKILLEDEFLNREYTKADITYISQNATLIPDEFFDTNHLKKYFEFNHNLNELDELHYNSIPAINAHTVFSIPNYLTNAFYNSFRNSTFHHQASAIIKHGVNASFTDENPILLSINSDFFDIAVFEGKNLLLYNSFKYTNAVDFIYFFLYPLNQLKIDSSKQNIIVLGEIIQHTDIIKELKTRVKSISHPIIKDVSKCRKLNNTQKLAFLNLFQ